MSLVYLAGPISGLSYGEAVDWREDAKKFLNDHGIDAASPMRYKSFLASEKAIKDNYDNSTLATTKAIYTRDKWDVSRSDVVLINFVGAEKVSIGSVLEVAWADMNNKPIIIAMEPGNIHEHAMIKECAGYIVQTLEEALLTVVALLKV